VAAVDDPEHVDAIRQLLDVQIKEDYSAALKPYRIE
jgi:hypothetical protein